MSLILPIPCIESFNVTHRPKSPLSGSVAISFESSSSEGAILLTKHDTICEDAQLMKRFKDYILKHHRSWLQFARDKGHDVEDTEQLLLVTGHDSTADFSMLAFAQNNQRRKVEFELSVPNVASASASWGRWKYQFPRVHEHHGPYRPASLPRLSVQEVVRDQCIFVRAFRVYRRWKLLPSRIKAAAGPANPGLDPPPEEPTDPLESGSWDSDESSKCYRIHNIHATELSWLIASDPDPESTGSDSEITYHVVSNVASVSLGSWFLIVMLFTRTYVLLVHRSLRRFCKKHI